MMHQKSMKPIQSSRILLFSLQSQILDFMNNLSIHFMKSFFFPWIFFFKKYWQSFKIEGTSPIILSSGALQSSNSDRQAMKLKYYSEGNMLCDKNYEQFRFSHRTNWAVSDKTAMHCGCALHPGHGMWSAGSILCNKVSITKYYL